MIQEFNPLGPGVSDDCKRDGETYTRMRAGWALKMADATAKLPPPGMLKGRKK